MPYSVTTVPGAEAPLARLAEFTIPAAVTCGGERCSASTVYPSTTTAISSVVEFPQLTGLGGELGLRGLFAVMDYGSLPDAISRIRFRSLRFADVHPGHSEPRSNRARSISTIRFTRA